MHHVGDLPRLQVQLRRDALDRTHVVRSIPAKLANILGSRGRMSCST